MRRIGVAVLAMACVVVAGCHRRKSSTTVVDTSGIFTTDEFPGGPVQDGNVADDQRALSPAGADAEAYVVCAQDGDRGSMIVIYRMESGQAYAHHFDGKSWTPPVPLMAKDFKPTTTTETFAVAFLNTENHDSEAARARDGDAVILWQADDVDDDGAADADDVNRCLFLTYFNVRQRDDAGLNHGFQAEATRVNDRDGEGEDVESFGFASDGLSGEARWAFNSNEYKWGDATSFLEVVWHQREDNDGSPGFEDRALHARRIVLDAPVADDLPLSDGAGIEAEIRLPLDGMGASDSGPDSQETQVDNFFATYNGVVLFRVAANNTTAGTDDVSSELEDNTPGSSSGAFNGVDPGTDQVLQDVAFGSASGTPSPPAIVHSVIPDATDGLANDASIVPRDFGFHERIAGTWVGSDEGISTMALGTYEFDQDADGTFDALNSGRVSFFELEESTGAVLAQAFISADDPTVNDTPLAGNVSARLSRNGDYLVMVYCAKDGDGASDDYALFAASYVTTRFDDDGLPGAPPALAESLVPAVQLNADIDGAPCYYWAFQQGLGYVCGLQSDPDVMNLMFEHSDASYDELFVARLNAGPALPASLVVDVTSIGVEDNDEGWRGFGSVEINELGRSWSCIDGGSDGNVLVVYDRDVIPGTGSEIHAFSKLMGVSVTSLRIDSGLFERQTGMFGTFTLVGTPPGENIGRFDPVDDSPDRPHAAETVHVLFHESDFVPFPGSCGSLRTRRFDVGAAATFEESWTPSAGATFQPPSDIDLPFVSTESFAFFANIRGVFRCGRRVGLYFSQAGHVYEQEFEENASPGEFGWHEKDGVSDPFLVDDDSNEEILGDLRAFPLHLSCCDLPRSMFFWVKNFGGDSHLRIQVRVHGD